MKLRSWPPRADTAGRRWAQAWILLAAVLAWPAGPAAGADDGPWRLSAAAGLPDWLAVSGSHRLRYETLDGQFRSGGSGGDQLLAMRTMLLGELRLGGLRAGAELIDSRAWLADSGTTLNTTSVNAVELLQGYVGLVAHDLVADGSTAEVKAGRLTIDVGSRRLVARNRFRNTINGFTGIDARWTSAGGREARAFYTLPVDRRPSARAALLDNTVALDDEGEDVRFWGLTYSEPELPAEIRGELFVFGLHEDDSARRPTANRNLYTPGMRVYRPARAGGLDFEVETAVQLGESRSSGAAANTADLDHFAHFHHIEAGYTFAADWSPRLVVQYDYASGDDDPADDRNGRFDTLFGARRFDFGPTGIYGPFARSNLSSPGIRLAATPHATIDGFVAYRRFHLASDRDAWTASGLRDATGNSGDFLGHQVEARLRWRPLPGNLQLEAGIAHLIAGDFVDRVAGPAGQGESTYGYGQVTVTF